MQEFFARLMVLLCSVLLPLSTLAQSNQVPFGARPAGMGDAFVSLADDGNALFWNPAGLPLLGHHELTSMHANPLGIPGYKNQTLGYVFPVSTSLALGGSVFSEGIFDVDNLTKLGLEFGWNTYQLSSAYRINERFSVGLSAKFVQIRIAEDQQLEDSPSGFGFDLGALYTVKKWRFGALWQDAGGLRVRHTSASSGETVEDGSQRSGSTETIRDQLFRLGVAYNPLNPLTLAMMISPGDRLHFGAEYWLFKELVGLRAGLQRDIYDTPSPETIYSAGISLKYSIAQFDYAYVMPPVLPNESRFSISLAVSFRRAKVKLSEPSFDQLYTSRFSDYRDSAIGQVELESEEKEPINTKIEFFIPDLMEKPEEVVSNKVMAPGEKNIFRFKPKSLVREKALTVDEPKSVRAEVRVSYTRGQKEEIIKERTERYTVNLLKTGAVSWKPGPAAAANFIAPSDPVIRDFAAGALKAYEDTLKSIEGPVNLVKAAILFDALGQLGIQYKPDDEKPFVSMIADTAGNSFDEIRYPRQTLHPQRRVGDCDDLTVLYAALLEAENIPTAIAFAPGHLYLFVDAGVRPYSAKNLLYDESLYDVDQGRVWIPVDATLIGQPFYQAVRKGAGLDRQQMAIVREAWTQFRPNYPPGPMASVQAPGRRSIARLYQDDVQWLRTRGLSGERKELLDRLDRNPNDQEALEKMAQLHKLESNHGQAGELYQRLSRLRPNEPSYRFETGILHLTDNQLVPTRQIARELQQQFPDKPHGYVLEALILKAEGKDRQALDAYNRAKLLDQDAEVVKEYKVDIDIPAITKP